MAQWSEPALPTLLLVNNASTRVRDNPVSVYCPQAHAQHAHRLLATVLCIRILW